LLQQFTINPESHELSRKKGNRAVMRILRKTIPVLSVLAPMLLSAEKSDDRKSIVSFLGVAKQEKRSRNNKQRKSWPDRNGWLDEALLLRLRIKSNI